MKQRFYETHITRIEFLLAWIGIIPLLYSPQILGGNPISLLLYPVALVVFLRAIILRLHDLGRSGLFAFVMLVPIANFVTLIVLLLMPQYDQYGERGSLGGRLWGKSPR